MAVDADDLIIRYSMGDGSASGAFDFANNKSVGGNISTTELRQGPPPSNLNNNLFDVVKGSESAATRAADYVDYRVIYAYNDAGTTAFDYSVYIPVDGANKPLNYWGMAPSTAYTTGWCHVGVAATVGVNATAGVLGGSTTPDETAAPPSGITWVQPTEATPLLLGDIPASQYRAIYVRRTVPKGAVAWDQAAFDLTTTADSGQ